MLDIRQQIKSLVRLIWWHRNKNSHLDIYQNQIRFIKSLLLIKNSDLITFGKDLNLVVLAHKEAKLYNGYIEHEIE